jgi:hypothetical protein
MSSSILPLSCDVHVSFIKAANERWQAGPLSLSVVHIHFEFMDLGLEYEFLVLISIQADER